MNSIFNYISYRKYLEDFYHYKKETEKGFSLRSFSDSIGIKFINYLSCLIDGSRKLMDKHIPSVIKVLDLDIEEADYFKILVNFDQAKTQPERNDYFSQILDLRKHKSAHKLEEKHFEYFSSWANVAIRELLNIHEFNPQSHDDYYKLGSMLRPRISKTEARKSIKILENLGLVNKEPDGTISLSKQQISTGNEAPAFFIKEFHNQMLKKAAESMDTFGPSERDISSITLSVSADSQARIKKAIQNLRQEITCIVEEDTDPDRVLQLNFQMFPLAEVNEDA